MSERHWLGSVTWADLLLVGAIASVLYLARLDATPICGEEPRWACGAVQMLETGDWIVPRQQGQLFPERPPMSSWAMAIVAQVRGEMDAIALRLPSSLAVIANALVIMVYAARFLPRFGATAAGLIYATMGQVLQIGRLGESEALFTLFLSSAMLAWHAMYSERAASWKVWCVGYSLAALAALVKGIQAPVYFGVATGGYLIATRQWRELFRWQHALGVACFALIVGSWQLPFYWMTDWPSVKAIWWGLAGDRLISKGLAAHVATYPLETFGCLLPWSLLLLFLALPNIRREVGKYREPLVFACIAVGLTYPSVWFAALARGRYFMPLYPVMAVPLATILQACVTEGLDGKVIQWWSRSLRGAAAVVITAAVIVLIAGMAPFGPLTKITQPVGFAVFFAFATVIIGTMLWRWSGDGVEQRARSVVVAVCCVMGLLQVGVVVNVYIHAWNNPRGAVAEARGKIPTPDSLVSFGPADHRFVYFYGKTIPELPWPTSMEQVPDSVDYFCFDRHIGDTPELRFNGRGRTYGTTIGTLPFEWEQVAVVNCERRIQSNPFVVTIIARRTDSTHRLAAKQNDSTDQK